MIVEKIGSSEENQASQVERKKNYFDDPILFLESFRDSNEYRAAFEERERKLKRNWQQKNPKKPFPQSQSDISERKRFFEETEASEGTFIRFGQNKVLKFNPNKIPEKFRDEISLLLDNYWRLNRLKAASQRSADTPRRFRFREYNIDVADHLRYDETHYNLHRQTAESLVQAGIAPNPALARWLVVFFTRSEGIYAVSPKMSQILKTEAERALQKQDR